MTSFQRTRYDRGIRRGAAISRADTAQSDRPYDFERLERAVRHLVAEHERLVREAGDLRCGLRDRDQRIRALEEQLIEANQRRQDTGKRIDELIAQLDQLDAQLGSLEPVR